MAYTTPGETREKVFRFMRDRLLEGTPPSVREVQEAMGFGAVESARKQLEILVEEGRLVKEQGKSRGYRLPDRAPGATQVPIIGAIQAGSLRAAIESPEGYVIIERRSKRSGSNSGMFALTVRGESMRDRGILPGDIVIVKRQDNASSGDIVVALVDDEATVKTLRVRGRGFWLEPANPDFEPIRPAAGTCKILGKVVELRRKMG